MSRSLSGSRWNRGELLDSRDKGARNRLLCLQESDDDGLSQEEPCGWSIQKVKWVRLEVDLLIVVNKCPSISSS